jgi:hypothetical protein
MYPRDEGRYKLELIGAVAMIPTSPVLTERAGRAITMIRTGIPTRYCKADLMSFSSSIKNLSFETITIVVGLSRHPNDEERSSEAVWRDGLKAVPCPIIPDESTRAISSCLLE